ncbi:(2Fe-2S)-binding protein [Fodinicurvata sediminis]|uniref:(2Fe-2S)-binding protein n=1 Tax=Fodinicurvata sediminis TaxID=1121832 RepID=UPI0003B5428D|nr:(2Fe-2S)-binding protein [Fodinicurvata sediminis]
MPARLLHLDATVPSRKVNFQINGKKVEGREGDSLLTAVLTNAPVLRRSEFGDGLRAGFCLMGACQDCWVALEDGRKVRACTTPLKDGVHVKIPEEAE